VLNAKRARKCEYVICVQNRGIVDDWGRQASAGHHVAFLIARLKDVVHSKEKDFEKRWILTFSEYAEIDIPNAWPGFRNPVFYTNVKKHFGIDVASLQFEQMPSVESFEKPVIPTKPMTLAEAKQGLAMTFGVTPSDIEIIVRG